MVVVVFDGVCLSDEKNDIADAERKSLYTLFLESVQSRLSSPEESPTDKVTEEQATTRSLVKMQSIVAQHLEIADVHDPLLAINFARYSVAINLITLLTNGNFGSAGKHNS